MIFAFSCQIIWTVMGYIAISSETMDLETRKNLILWGGFILALGNGTVEAFINPVVATMFTKAKTKWLNILHAGWPGGLVLAGMLVILMEEAAWENKILLIAIPAVIYFVMLIKQTFPVQERVSAGVSYKGMLSEFGFLGGLVAAFVIFLQLDDSLKICSFMGADVDLCGDGNRSWSLHEKLGKTAYVCASFNHDASRYDGDRN
jgi:hypothetical protein